MAVVDHSPLLVPRPYRVVAKTTEQEGPDLETVTIKVEPLDGELPDFEPAQVSMLGAFGVGEAAISISSHPGQRDHHDYTIRRAGAITGALVDTPVGGTITVRGPFGSPWPLADHGQPNLLIVAGGLGLAPLRALVDQVEPAQLERVVLAYGAKDPASLLYQRDYERWSDSGIEVVVTVDSPSRDGNSDPDEWDGAVGVVPALFAELDLPWAETAVFLCGPDVMMHFSALKLLELGVPAGQIWLTLERNMQCGNALCGHCQLGPFLVCRDGPVANYADVGRFHRVEEM